MGCWGVPQLHWSRGGHEGRRWPARPLVSSSLVPLLSAGCASYTRVLALWLLGIVATTPRHHRSPLTACQGRLGTRCASQADHPVLDPPKCSLTQSSDLAYHQPPRIALVCSCPLHTSALTGGLTRRAVKTCVAAPSPRLSRSSRPSPSPPAPCPPAAPPPCRCAARPSSQTHDAQDVSRQRCLRRHGAAWEGSEATVGGRFASLAYDRRTGALTCVSCTAAPRDALSPEEPTRRRALYHTPLTHGHAGHQGRAHG